MPQIPPMVHSYPYIDPRWNRSHCHRISPYTLMQAFSATTKMEIRWWKQKRKTSITLTPIRFSFHIDRRQVKIHSTIWEFQWLPYKSEVCLNFLQPIRRWRKWSEKIQKQTEPKFKWRNFRPVDSATQAHGIHQDLGLGSPSNPKKLKQGDPLPPTTRSSPDALQPATRSSPISLQPATRRSPGDSVPLQPAPEAPKKLRWPGAASGRHRPAKELSAASKASTKRMEPIGNQTFIGRCFGMNRQGRILSIRRFRKKMRQQTFKKNKISFLAKISILSRFLSNHGSIAKI